MLAFIAFVQRLKQRFIESLLDLVAKKTILFTLTL